MDPGLRRIAGPLFFAGVALGYYILPKGLEVLIGFTPATLTNLVDFGEYFSFITRMLLVFGIAFEIPLFVVLLNLAGVVSGKALGRYRPWIIIGTFVFAAVATPSTDPFSMLMLAVPMLDPVRASPRSIARLDRPRRGRGARPTSGDEARRRRGLAAADDLVARGRPVRPARVARRREVTWTPDRRHPRPDTSSPAQLDGCRRASLPCDLLAVDEAYPAPVADDDRRHPGPPGVAARAGAAASTSTAGSPWPSPAPRSPPTGCSRRSAGSPRRSALARAATSVAAAARRLGPTD